jgi:uncharacterized protein YuzE
MRFTYSPEADALAIDLAEGTGHIGTKKIGPNVFADFDARGRLVGIEVLDASRVYPRAELEQLPTGVEYITLAEAATEEKVPRTELRPALRKGELPGIRRGRG